MKGRSVKMKTKLIYESAELEVLRFAASDVITTSDLDEVDTKSEGGIVDTTDWSTDDSW